LRLRYGDGAKCGAKFADTLHVIYLEVTGVCSEWKETKRCGAKTDDL
jgi:hypothetical protein